jgi:spore maturation protein CgeB
MRVKILLVTPSAPYRLGWYCRQALEGLGHAVGIFDFDRKFFPPWRSETILNRRLIQAVSQGKPDIVFVTKGKNIFPKTILALKESCKLIAMNWWPDDPYGFEFSKGIASCYDYYFTNDSGLIDDYLAAGAKKVHFLPFGCNPEVHRRVPLTGEEETAYRSDLCFVGQWSPLREEVLEGLSDFNLKVWGPGWKKRVRRGSKLRGKVRGSDDGLGGKEMVKAYNATKIVLNIHLWFKSGREDGVNMRLFEAAGCRSFQLSDWKKEIPTLFRVGKEMACYKDGEELRQLIEHYLPNEEERETMARRGQKRAYSEHTYLHRMQQIMEIVEDGMNRGQ